MGLMAFAAPMAMKYAKRVFTKLASPKIAKQAAGVVAAGAGFEVGSRIVSGRGRKPQLIDPRTGKPFKKHRRQGLSGRDIMGAQKVARVVSMFGYKPKFKKRKGKR